MRFTSPPRRVAAVLAVSTLGLSTAVLGAAGIASAGGSAMSLPYDTTYATMTTPVPDGICQISWLVIGGQGEQPGGTAAGELRITTNVLAGDVFNLYPGRAGSGGTGGTNGLGHNGEDGVSGGGGGGAASEVIGHDFSLLAYGGDGAGDGVDGAAGGRGYGGGHNYWDGTAWGGTDEATTQGGNGVIKGTGVACAPPPAPRAVSASAGDGSVTVRFSAPQLLDDEDELLTNDAGVPFQAPDGSYRYSTDAGSTWHALSTTMGSDDQLSGTITGLTNGTTYSITLRAGSLVGPGLTSAPVTATPLGAPPVGPAPTGDLAAPTDVAATVGPSSIKVTWQAPADTTGISGYQAYATPVGDQSSARTVFCKPATPTGTSCLLAAIPGLAYSVNVASLDAAGEFGAAADWVTTAKVPSPAAPATVPHADGVLGLDDEDGTVTAGQKVIVTGKDLLPGSTVDIIVYSTPRKLGSALVAVDGTFSHPVILPVDLANGTHHLVASGIDVNGNPRYAVTELTVTGSTAGLAFTGFDVALPLTGALIALGAGVGLMFAARRRKVAEQAG